jgi:uncharacterized NAD-dependent epimerase/dehydratase family protein
MPECAITLSCPELTIEDGAKAGASTLLVGVANAGGVWADNWTDYLELALKSGMDVASGLHDRLTDIPRLRAAAEASGRRLIDVRHPTQKFSVGTGAPRSGRRLLTVGTDCSVGKMYTSLAIENELRARGASADFRATGQTGIMIAGAGVSVDAVISDFISGAVEWLSPAAEDDAHWDIIEGQGSLFHPSFAGVSLGLLHGAQAEALVMCHEPTRTHMRGLPHRHLPDIAECIAANEAAARLTHPNARCIGVAVNTSRMGAVEAGNYLTELSKQLDMPCVDPIATGIGPLVDCLDGHA